MTLVFAFVLALPVAAQQSPNAETLWEMMVKGNSTYMSGKISFDELVKERKAGVDGQAPPVIVLACSDSRVPPELVFNQSIGALFVVRTAGNTADEFGLASIEYAVSHTDPQWGTLIVVLGHEKCGAVVEAMKFDDPGTPPLVALVDRIRRSFVMGQTTLPEAIKANARASAAWLTAESPIVRRAVMDGKVKIIPAYYEMKSGKVREIECK
ncbi:MAG: carbonic anhydrase [Vicinamibacterales bacterium]